MHQGSWSWSLTKVGISDQLQDSSNDEPMLKTLIRCGFLVILLFLIMKIKGYLHKLCGIKSFTIVVVRRGVAHSPGQHSTTDSWISSAEFDPHLCQFIDKCHWISSAVNNVRRFLDTYWVSPLWCN